MKAPGAGARPEPILQMVDIHKQFPGVYALKGVSFDLYPGEVHALLGENGAGKSTLIKILAGVHPKDRGTIYWQGREVDWRTPSQAQAMGISVIYQEFNLVPHLNAVENIFLGRIPARGPLGLVNWKRMAEETRRHLEELGVEVDLRRPVSQLSVAQQQTVEIAKALSLDARVIVMDEPTATLTQHEIEKLFAAIQRLKQKGVAIIYVSHRLEEIFRICDRVTVLRDGEKVMTRPTAGLSVDELIRHMVGRTLDQKYPRVSVPAGDELLRVEGLTRRGAFSDVSFTLRRGEIYGLAGLVGSGRTEVARALFGADPLDAGQVYFKGQPVKIASPQDAVRLGIGLLPEERKGQGLCLILPVRSNMTLVVLERFSPYQWVNRPAERAFCQALVERLRIRTPHLEQLVKNLSGGNQQKVVLAKWFARNCDLLIFDEPTRGIDVGAKIEIYRLMNELKQQGVSILMISSELPEILGMSDRIGVMKEGRLVAELDREEADQEKILAYALGGVA